MTGNGVRHFLDLIDIPKPVLAGMIGNSRAMKAARAHGVASAPLAQPNCTHFSGSQPLRMA